MRHPLAGDLHLRRTRLSVPDSDADLFIYHPEPAVIRQKRSRHSHLHDPKVRESRRLCAPRWRAWSNRRPHSRPRSPRMCWAHPSTVRTRVAVCPRVRELRPNRPRR
jgi:hypothetical protein